MGGLKIPGIEKNAKVCIEVCTVGEDMDCVLEEDMASEVPKSNTAHCDPKLLKECTAQVVDVDVHEHKEDIELRIFGETENQVQSAVTSINRLISNQFTTEEYEHESIRLLHKNEENALKLEARKMQLVFRIDRNLNSIELKGSKESISEMKLKIKDALNKAEKEDSRKAVQWVRQDPSESNKVSQATDALSHQSVVHGLPDGTERDFYTAEGMPHE